MSRIITPLIIAIVVTLLPSSSWAEDAIIVLGAPFAQNGEPKAPVLRRMKIALQQAKRYPKATVIVTGGAVKGRAEAPLMARWLKKAGLAAKRIRIEAKARHTGENASLSLPILKKLGAKSAIIVTDRFHLMRAGLHFRWAFAEAGAKNIALRGVGADDGLRGKARLKTTLREYGKIARDALWRLSRRVRKQR